MKIPNNSRYVLFGGSFALANKLQWVADRKVEGFSAKQWFLLRSLKDMPASPLPTITTLAKETDTSRQNVTKMLEVLQRQGYVLLKDHPSDQRSRTVEMTNHGLRMLEQMADKAQPFLEELYAGIEAAECDIAAAVLVKMAKNLYRMQENMSES